MAAALQPTDASELPSLVAVPGARFWMGSDRHLPNEGPRHRVAVAAFRIGVTAVTRGQYSAFLASTGRAPPPFWGPPFQDARQPVCGVSWFDASAFCEWLGKLRGERIHLPTEAQREWAASGGDDRRIYPWGDDPPGERAPRSSPPRVAEEPPNAFGLFDMGSGVHEWCADWYGADWYAHSPSDEPRGPSGGERRSARGGSWRHQLPYSRVAARSALDPGKHFSDFGFRVAASEGFEYLP